MLLRQVKRHIHAADTHLARRLVAPALAVWIVLDGLGSVFAGAWFKVVLNTGFLTLAYLLLFWPEPKSFGNAI